MLKNRDVESGADLRQYYTGSYMQLGADIIYIRAVHSDPDPANSVVEYLKASDLDEAAALPERHSMPLAGLETRGLLYGTPMLGMREVDGQLVYIGNSPHRNGRRGYRAENADIKTFTKQYITGAKGYVADLRPNSTKTIKEIFFPTFYSPTEAKDRLRKGLSLGSAINHNLGLFVSCEHDVCFIAFRNHCVGYYGENGLTLYKGFEVARPYIQRHSGAK